MNKFFKSAVVVVAGVCLLGGGILVGGIMSSEPSQQVNAASTQSKTYSVQHHTESANCPTDHHISSAQNVSFQTVTSVEPVVEPVAAPAVVDTPTADQVPAVEEAPVVETPAADPAPVVDQPADNTYVCPNGYENCPYDGNCIAGQDCMNRYNAECNRTQNSTQSGHHSESGRHHRGGHH